MDELEFENEHCDKVKNAKKLNNNSIKVNGDRAFLRNFAFTMNDINNPRNVIVLSFVFCLSDFLFRLTLSNPGCVEAYFVANIWSV